MVGNLKGGFYSRKFSVGGEVDSITGNLRMGGCGFYEWKEWGGGRWDFKING